jgi:hypothetical protein
MGVALIGLIWLGCGSFGGSGAVGPTVLPTETDPSTTSMDSGDSLDSADTGAVEDTGQEWPGAEVACAASDATMAFSTEQPTTDGLLRVSVTAETGYVWIGMAVDGGLVSEGSDTITGSGPYTWSFGYTVTEPGWLSFTFTADSGATAICEGRVYAEGDPVGGTDTELPDAEEPPENKVGIGLVGPGDASQWDRAAELAGPGGHVKLIFPGLVLGMGGAPQDWIDAVQGTYDRDLVPVIRLNPPWDDHDVRHWSDDSGHRDYTSYAASFAAVVADLPLREGWPLWLEVLNEPNLCSEWTCDGSDGGSLDYRTTAAEYAALLRDVTQAIRDLGESRHKVINAGLAPGGTTTCECGGSGWEGGITSEPFIAAMLAEVPSVFRDLDGFSSHAYPASGEGWGFFESYDNSGPGLAWWQKELAAAGVPSQPVLITETGWTVDAGAYGSRDDVASWTVSAWNNDWLPDSRIEAVMPFQLQDAAWDSFSWLRTDGGTYPVFDAVRDWRCAQGYPEPC